MQDDKMIPTDLFEFAYVPDWYGQLDELAAMALPESWRFKKPTAATKNTDTPILERYINMIFRKQSIDYNTEPNPNRAAKFFHVENEYACFHTGLYDHRYKAIYCCFERNKKLDTTFSAGNSGRACKKKSCCRTETCCSAGISEQVTAFNSNLSDQYEEDRPCHDAFCNGRILSRKHLSYFGNGISECQNDRTPDSRMDDRLSKIITTYKIRESDKLH